MNVAYQFLKVEVFLTDNGFVTVLKKLTMPAVSAIKCHGISGQQSSHEGGKTGIA